MKLTKDEIDEIVTEAEREIVTGPMFGAKESLHRVLTRKLGTPVPTTPYDGWRNIVRDYRGATPQTVSRVPVALAELVPELWAAANGVDESRSPGSMLNLANGFEWKQATERLEALRAVLKRIDEVKP